MKVGSYLYFVYSLTKGFCWYICSCARQWHEYTIFVCMHDGALQTFSCTRTFVHWQNLICSSLIYIYIYIYIHIYIYIYVYVCMNVCIHVLIYVFYLLEDVCMCFLCLCMFIFIFLLVSIYGSQHKCFWKVNEISVCIFHLGCYLSVWHW